MNSKRNTCQAHFNSGQKKKLDIKKGDYGYKFKDLEYKFERFLDDVGNIASAKKARRPPRNLSACTSSDTSTFLKKIPENIAFDFGYYVLPFTAAQASKCLSTTAATPLLGRVKHATTHLVHDCELARIQLKGGISREYDAMRCDNSYIAPLLIEALNIIRMILSEMLLPPATPNPNKT